MYNIASLSTVELTPLLTIFVGMLGGFYVLLKFILGQSATSSEADRAERKEMAIAFNRVAIATETAAREAKQRNGHLGEQNIQIATLVSSQNSDVSEIKESNKKIVDILSKSAVIGAKDLDVLLSPEQHIGHQVVEHQEIKRKG